MIHTLGYTDDAVLLYETPEVITQRVTAIAQGSERDADIRTTTRFRVLTYSSTTYLYSTHTTYHLQQRSQETIENNKKQNSSSRSPFDTLTSAFCNIVQS